LEASSAAATLKASLSSARLLALSSTAGKRNRAMASASPSPAAEAALSKLKTTVAELKADVARVEKSYDDQQVKILSVRVTQSLLAVDSVPDISKGAAAEAFRAKNRASAMAISVLIARRKGIIKDLNNLGDRVDTLLASSNVDAVVDATIDDGDEDEDDDDDE
jgi:hypothetical protein